MVKILEDEGLDEFFINNYPKIKKESEMYRVSNPKNMIELVKKLYNRAEQELNYTNNNNYQLARDADMKSMLQVNATH